MLVLVGNPEDRFSHNEAHLIVRADCTRCTTYNGFSGQFFRIFEKKKFCFAVSICDLVHDVDAIHSLCLVLTATGNLFSNMSDVREIAVSRASLIFQKDFQMLLADKECEI